MLRGLSSFHVRAGEQAEPIGEDSTPARGGAPRSCGSPVWSQDSDILRAVPLQVLLLLGLEG